MSEATKAAAQESARFARDAAALAAEGATGRPALSADSLKKPAEGAAADKSATATEAAPARDRWSEAEIKAANADCDRRLSGLQILFDRLDPIKENGCGLPAPIRLNGFGGEIWPPLAFSPAPTLSCKLAESLRQWFVTVVQPQARAHLHANIVKATVLSSYNCRSRFDNGRLSQHAYANAVDIGEFTTEKGERLSIEGSWNAKDERAAFLRDIHAGACRIFGTTLGPAANNAHKNHFHLDMTERRQPLCDFTPGQLRILESMRKYPIIPAAIAAAGSNEAGPVLEQGDAGALPFRRDLPVPSRLPPYAKKSLLSRSLSYRFSAN
ncbi:MAG TPA: extensin family protein [Hyphomicrobiales bacterium]|nr:extensin family protein [Hyphomicrobiales bacterium]